LISPAFGGIMGCRQKIFKGFYLMKQFFVGFHFCIAAALG
jgi:hypothetical protein